MPEADLDALSIHLDNCAACRAKLDALAEEHDEITAALKASPIPSNDEDAPGYRRVKQFGERVAQDPGAVGLVPAAVTPELLIGRQLGAYTLVEKIGAGGMGTVYKAHHAKLDKFVAIKSLPAERMRDPAAVARFEREMRAVGRMDHPNIVRATDAGEVDGIHFLAMDFVDGVDLSQLSKQHGPLPVAEACELIRQAALGLEEASEHNMVHRDIKPSNLILARRRRKPPIVKILDMGLAMLAEVHTPEQETLTATGQTMGTLDYMAPEQGGDSGSVDIRADIYALGATLYRLLCGHVIYHGKKYLSPVQKITALATRPAPLITEQRVGIPTELAKLVHRMLEKDPAARPQSPHEVAAALTPFAADADLASLLDAEGSQDSANPMNREPTEAMGPSTHIDASPPPTEWSSAAVGTHATERITRVGHARQTQWKVGGLIVVGALLVIAGMAAVQLLVPGRPGRVHVETTVPGIRVQLVDGDQPSVTGQSGTFTIAAGEQALEIAAGDTSFRTRTIHVAGGDEITVRIVDDSTGSIQALIGDELIGQGPRPPDIRTMIAADRNGALLFQDIPFNDHGVSIPLGTSPNRPSDALTFETWIETHQRNANAATVIGASAFRFSIYNCWSFDAPGRGVAEVADSLPLNRWTHVACVVERDEMWVYFDGKRVKAIALEAPRSSLPLTSERIRMGGRGFVGRLDEIRLSTVARYKDDFDPPQLHEQFQPDAHTLALYHCEQTDGSTLIDASGNGYHGELQNAQWSRTSLPVADYALQCGEAPAAVTQHTFPGIQQTMTIEAKLRLPRSSGAAYCVSLGVMGSGGNVQAIRWDDQRSLLHGFGLSKTNLAPRNRWFHCACVYDGKQFRLYIDGKHVDTVAYARPINNRTLTVGKYNFAGGQIDEIRISNIARYDRDFYVGNVYRHSLDAATVALYHCDEGSGEILRDSSGNGFHARVEDARWVDVSARYADVDRDRASEGHASP